MDLLIGREEKGVRNYFAARGRPVPFRLSPPPNLRELLLPFWSDGYASEFAVDLPRRRLTELLHYIRTQAYERLEETWLVDRKY